MTVAVTDPERDDVHRYQRDERGGLTRVESAEEERQREERGDDGEPERDGDDPPSEAATRPGGVPPSGVHTWRAIARLDGAGERSDSRSSARLNTPVRTDEAHKTRTRFDVRVAQRLGGRAEDAEATEPGQFPLDTHAG